MKKTNIFKAILMMSLMLVGATALTSCGEDPLDTDQYAGGPVKLLAYGPNPVARMGELRIIGVGLDQVQSVTIPGAGDITDINRISSEEIRVVVPNEAVIGKIKLNSTSGTIESVTSLKYTEPVGFDNQPFSKAEVKAGELLTISGEYLNLVQQVIFTDGVVIEKADFQAQDRKNIVVSVPEEAQTGKVTISFCATEDTIPNLIASPAELKVVVPKVDEVADLTGKKPGDKISQKGSDLDLVTMLTVAGQPVDFTIEDGTISYELPINTPATATVSVWPASGVECIIAYIGMQLPTELKATPASDIKPGDKIVITGKDLDVVSYVTFPGVADAVDVSDQSATSLTVTVPDAATSGDLVLYCKSGASVSVAITTAKPEAESYNPSPVNAGADLTINGKNLELVAKITFPEGLAVENFKAQSATALTLTVPVAAVAGELEVVMKNGETVTFKKAEILSPIFCFIPELPGEDEEFKAGDLCKVNVKNADKLTGVQVDGVNVQYILQGETLYFGIPATANKKSVTKLISSNGEVEYNIAFKPNSEIVTTIWSGPAALSWSGDGQIYMGDDGGQSLIAAGAKAGDILRIKYETTADDWCIQIWEGHWGTQYDQIKPDNYDLAGNDYYYNITLTDELLKTFTTAGGWGGIVLTQGQSAIAVSLELLQKVSLETTLFEGELIADDWGNQPYALSDAGAEFAEFGVKAGQLIRFYVTALADDWKLEILEGHWGPHYAGFCNPGSDTEGGKFTEWDLAANGGAVSFTLTQDMIDAAFVQQWWGGIFVLNGDNCKITKITVE